MKVMISQPMNGKTNGQIIYERKELVEQLKIEGYEVLDSVLDITERKSPVYYLSKSIEILDQADMIVFMAGWEKARGCKIEHLIAKEYGKKIKYEYEIMNK